MSFAQTVRGAAGAVAQGGDPRQAVTDALQQAVPQAASEGGGLDPRDFVAAREQGDSIGTRIEQRTTSLNNAGEALNSSSHERGRGGPVHVICPMVIPRGRTFFTMLPAIGLVIIGLLGSFIFLIPEAIAGGNPLINPFFGVHYWIITAGVAGFMWWRQGMVMVPEGCEAIVTRFGKRENNFAPGRVTLFNPWKRVSYIVNTTREYPFNAPIRSAPTKSGVQASVDLFVQFRITDATSFVYTLGGVHGFQEKLNNAISETTRSLIYEQEASAIYDMVGESTHALLDQLNRQFGGIVELTSANITHAEPSNQEYRMDLAAPEMVRVAKDAYTFEYELQLRKEQNEGDLNKELATLNETLSAIQADIAQYQAQMDTALERETNKARSSARQRFVEAESEANANAALLQAQALDIRAVSAAEAPEILNYRFRETLLDKLEGVADSLPQVLRIGSGDGASVDYLRIAQEIIGQADTALFSEEDMDAIRGRLGEIRARIGERQLEIRALVEETETKANRPVGADPGEDRVEEIRQSVSEQAIDERLSENASETAPEAAPDAPPPSGPAHPHQDPPLPPWSQRGPEGPGPNQGGQ
ncbi:regulator of protease activity HflC (stomatin/prohibitin superfamily) [Nocardiopsis sp. Huas11]|uniref:SPFH domain-containing protein n=1 Tax=Nocardiopsis sp. Huas11 TaxID=2183912 RepID=UPI000EB02877|nr:SPFH domain-containing protein [Nocardiopsis sp. Huas11]RKS04795.1 regulator of protease activity HflC (stomatin/prohibitin superfamily) [Nocardiopsis sp. Huas11]